MHFHKCILFVEIIRTVANHLCSNDEGICCHSSHLGSYYFLMLPTAHRFPSIYLCIRFSLLFFLLFLLYLLFSSLIFSNVHPPSAVLFTTSFFIFPSQPGVPLQVRQERSSTELLKLFKADSGADQNLRPLVKQLSGKM